MGNLRAPYPLLPSAVEEAGFRSPLGVGMLSPLVSSGSVLQSVRSLLLWRLLHWSHQHKTVCLDMPSFEKPVTPHPLATPQFSLLQVPSPLPL